MSSILIGSIWLGEKIFFEKLINVVNFSLQVPDNLYQMCVFLYCFITLRLTTLQYCFSQQEHEKRCWSVDFNLMDPKLLASGSDDAKGTILFQTLCRRHRLCVCHGKNRNVLFQVADSSAAFSIVIAVVMWQDLTEQFGSWRRRGFVWINISCFTFFCVMYSQLTFSWAPNKPKCVLTLVKLVEWKPQGLSKEQHVFIFQKQGCQ